MKMVVFLIYAFIINHFAQQKEITISHLHHSS